MNMFKHENVTETSVDKKVGAFVSFPVDLVTFVSLLGASCIVNKQGRRFQAVTKAFWDHRGQLWASKRPRRPFCDE